MYLPAPWTPRYVPFRENAILLVREHVASSSASAEIHAAAEAVARDVAGCGSVADQEYWATHQARFIYALQRVRSMAPPAPGVRVLDIGSHFLHQAALFRALGYSVVGIDVPVFAALPHVRRRADTFGVEIQAVPAEAFAEGTFLSDQANACDVTLFCETLEHITFNPIRFWQRVHGIMREGGIIYITTPNSITLLTVLGAAWGLLSLSRIGLNIRQIFAHVTYGHHWKEYSAPELRRYFAMLSPDFHVEVRRHAIPGRVIPFTGSDPGSLVRRWLMRLGDASGFFAHSLEAVVRLRERSEWRTVPPSFS